MKIAVMQPYFFPYIGYFQLMNAVDVFVIYDDVNYIKQGWINRNRILLNNVPHYLNLELSGASSFKKINEITVGKNKALKTIESCYKKAAYFPKSFTTIENILNCEETNLAGFLEYSLRTLADKLGIKTKIIVSSDIHKNNELKGSDKIIAICQELGATAYINAIGGQELYHKDSFLKQGIDLKFMKSNDITYRQFTDEFTPWLSIIDVLMFNSMEKVKNMLQEYTLI